MDGFARTASSALAGLALAVVATIASEPAGAGANASEATARRTVVRSADPIARLPRRMAALGDSFNTGFAARPGSGDNPEFSWSIGADASVNSLYRRLRVLHPRAALKATLIARDGSKIADLPRQVALAADAGEELLTIQSGGNDICGATRPDRITSAKDIRESLVAAFKVIRERLPNARILITSITDEARWNDGSSEVPGNGDHLADGTVCDPQVDGNGRQSRARRLQIQTWERRFNAILREFCEANLHCRYDGGAFFRLAYTADDVAPTDAFHPSVHGLARFAATAWRAGFDFADQTAPRVSARYRRSAGRFRVTLSASDSAGAGVEYRIGPTTFTTYTGPIELQPGQRLAFRAVDRNGNISAAYTLSAP